MRATIIFKHEDPNYDQALATFPLKDGQFLDPISIDVAEIELAEEADLSTAQEQYLNQCSAVETYKVTG